MSESQLKPTDMEQISAFLDGELPETEARQVAEMIERDPAWKAAADTFGRLDVLLEAWPTPRLAGDLSTSILAATRRRKPRPMWVRWMAPLAAAATIVVAVTLFAPSPQQPDGEIAANPNNTRVNDIIEGVAHDDQFVVENLDVFDDYDVLVQYETIEALAALEQQPET